jgi:hypothetical protein
VIGPTFLRRPRGAEWVADVVRGLAVVSIPVAVIGWGGTSFAVLMLCLLGTVIPRALGLRPAFDIGVSVLALVAGWSAVLSWYTSIFLWDKIIHVLLGGLVAAVVFVIGSDVGVLPRAEGMRRLAIVLLCVVGGFGMGAVWEILEWAGHTFIDSRIYVGYVDTIGDLGADGGGALAAGLLLPWLMQDRRVVGEVR